MDSFDFLDLPVADTRRVDANGSLLPSSRLKVERGHRFLFLGKCYEVADGMQCPYVTSLQKMVDVTRIPLPYYVHTVISWR